MSRSLVTGIYRTPNGWGWMHGPCGDTREIYFFQEAAIESLLRHVQTCPDGRQQEAEACTKHLSKA